MDGLEGSGVGLKEAVLGCVVCSFLLLRAQICPSAPRPPHSQPTAYDADATQLTSLAQNVRRGQWNAQRLTAHGAAEV